MARDISYFRLGLFVIGGVTLVVTGVILFGAGAYFRETVTVETAIPESVQGLDPGAAVKYQGVTIGKVAKIELAIWPYRTGNARKDFAIGKYVVLLLAIRRDMFPAASVQEFKDKMEESVDAGLRARMASSGLTGPAYIEIIFLPVDQNPPPKIEWTPQHLYVPSAPSVMTKVVSGVEALADTLQRIKLAELVDHVDQLVGQLSQTVNAAQVPVLRQKAEALFDQAHTSAVRLNAILANPAIDTTLNNLGQTSTSLKTYIGGDDFKAFVGDLPHISAKLRTSAARIDDVLASPQFQKMLDGLSTTATETGPAAVELRRVLRELSNILTTQGKDIQAIVVNLRKFVEDAADVAEDAKNNPSRVIFGAPPPHTTIGAKR